ncbi:putative membrane protein YdjX (TVP38/TMEM64 family) [Caldalkalibacillus uzonensis]|uniref:TVP38/TMEM64 family membrane protein n=1 Tax=Caldalkalibacillus uzonensis TaxID=353224 RepID=A0ABU0CQQ4_9BACI|nr:VTT domain-containing protein [Caldalkalibacillus uzonensis]MDQ0338418.1 putative membrane protein YdjX (TVP38/TMEM64 family) [Caldalkalibacillus uzonensis]
MKIKRKKRLAVIIVICLFILAIKSPWFAAILDQDISSVSELRDEMGYRILMLTVPLGIIQGTVTIFPFMTIVAVHVFSFGLVQGLFFSWLCAFLGAMICFILGRYFFHDWSEQLWENKKEKYERFIVYFHKYGMWGLILLRTIPFMPSNLISIMAALSPINFRAYLWSSVIGNITMVMLLALLSTPFALDDAHYIPLLTSFIILLITLFLVFLFQHLVKQKQRRYEGEEL